MDKLLAIEWKILTDFCDCMQLIASGLDILQGEKRACQGYILPVLYEIKEGMQDLARKGFSSEYGRPSLEEFIGFPLLEDMFQQYNTTLSSSAPVDRLFSKALIVFSPRRNRLSDSNFESTKVNAFCLF